MLVVFHYTAKFTSKNKMNMSCLSNVIVILFKTQFLKEYLYSFVRVRIFTYPKVFQSIMYATYSASLYMKNVFSVLHITCTTIHFYVI